MKLNFWQWLGIILLLIGGIGYVMFKDGGKQQPTAPAPPTPEVTAPAIPPTTQPVP